MAKAAAGARLPPRAIALAREIDPARAGGGRVRARADPAAGARVVRHEDRPPRRPVGLPLATSSSAWTPTGSLGHVQGGQYGGYLFPMGPFFAVRHALGLAPWLIQRLWLGTAAGARRLGHRAPARRAARTAPRGVAHAVAGALVLLNPYVVVFANRTQRHAARLRGAAVAAAVAVHRGVRDPRRWWWPAAFALIVTATGGGVNAAVTAWVLLGPLLLLVYEPALGGVAWRAVRGFAWRAGGDDARRLAVVDRPAARAGALRHRLPPVHRAAGHDLGHHQPAPRACG